MVNKKTPNPIDKHIGARVRMRRMMLSMTQEKLSHALGLTFQQVQKYEKGTNRIGGSRMQQISRALNVRPSYFFDGAPGEAAAGEDSPSIVTDMLATRDGIEVAKAFQKLSTKARRCVRALVETMAEEDS